MWERLHDVRAAVLAPVSVVEPPPTRQAAVALVVTADREVLFIRRAERAGDTWSGQIALPGGKKDPGDPDLLAAAIREADEEVGLRLYPASLVGPLDDMMARPVFDMVVRPYVFALPERPTLRPNVEVADVHWVGLDRLLSGEGRGPMPYTWQGASLTLPSVHIGATVPLWGMTLRIVDGLLHRIDGRGHGLDRR